MQRRKEKSCGELVAAMLAKVWRNSPPKLELSVEEFGRVVPLLLKSGAGALGWWRVRDSELRNAPPAIELHNAYRHFTLLSCVSEIHLAQVVASFRAIGVEAILIKGRAIASVYPEPGLRPYADFDFCVRREQYEVAAKNLRELREAGINIDLHFSFGGVIGKTLDPKTDACEIEDIFARSHIINIAGSRVRVPAAEDHLRLVCLHLLKHGCHSPLWLCDVAALLESHSSSLNWERMLGTDRRFAWAIVCVIKLAQQLLGANEIFELPIEYRKKNLPRWLKPAVLKQWKLPSPHSHTDPQRMSSHILHPTKWREALSVRWSNPIQATYYYDGAFNDFPRLPFLIGDGLSRVAHFIIGRSRCIL